MYSKPLSNQPFSYLYYDSEADWQCDVQEERMIGSGAGAR